MSKKTLNKIVRKNLTGVPGSGEKLAVNKSPAKVLPIAGKTYMSNEDLAKRYQYVKDDLKLVAYIAIPIILGLIIATFFIKI